jgi:hypothetical protein
MVDLGQAQDQKREFTFLGLRHSLVWWIMDFAVRDMDFDA